MIKRKGQIIPKRLVRSVEKKAQHNVKFGCDVKITGRTITALTEGPIVTIEGKDVLKKKNKRIWKGCEIEDLQLHGLGNTASFALGLKP